MSKEKIESTIDGMSLRDAFNVVAPKRVEGYDSLRSEDVTLFSDNLANLEGRVLLQQIANIKKLAKMMSAELLEKPNNYDELQGFFAGISVAIDGIEAGRKSVRAELE